MKEMIEAERLEKLRPDADKLVAWAEAFDAVKIPEVSSPEAGKVVGHVMSRMKAMCDAIRQSAKELGGR